MKYIDPRSGEIVELAIIDPKSKRGWRRSQLTKQGVPDKRQAGARIGITIHNFKTVDEAGQYDFSMGLVPYNEETEVMADRLRDNISILYHQLENAKIELARHYYKRQQQLTTPVEPAKVS